MNFEKIELIGFKSFADKSEIVFDNGVTAIVGPNGCGKSNIADAVRWVLGEMSAKTLRGSSMTDVIFNGTQNRKSLSYCEVSLFFDNTNKIFKSCDYNEVILTRKLFKSGESEYFINKQPARMRDIVDLLHECGVSKNGYSIIGQGKVAEILNSKPEDRRVIFEEAVGISKSKATKAENERKLARTRENMLRLNDIITEISRQLEPAQRSAEKTRKFLELSEELKYHEINNFLYKSENASTIKGKIELRIKAIGEELELNEKELKKSIDSYNEHTKERDDSDIVIAKLHDEILEKSVDQEKLQGKTSVYKEKISYCKSEIERLENEYKEKQEKIELLQKAITAKKESLTSSTNEKETLIKQNLSLNDKLNKVLTEISQGENASQSAQSEIISVAETLADISKNIGSLDTEKSVISTRQQEVIDKVQQLSSEISNLLLEKSKVEAEIVANKALQEDLTKKIDEFEQKVKALNDEISTLSNSIYNLTLNLNKLQTNLRIQQGVKESYEGYPTAVKKLMLDAKTNPVLREKIKGVVAEVITTDKKYELAIETAIGNAVQNIISATPEDAQYILEYLKKLDAGRATILPISWVKTHQDSFEMANAMNERGAIGYATKLVKFDSYFQRIVDFLLGNTLIVDNSYNALQIAKKFNNNFKIVTLEGDVFNTSGAMSGGSRRRNLNLMATERIIEQLKTEIAQCEAEIDKASKKKEKLTNESNSLVDLLDKFTKDIQIAKQEISALTVKKDTFSEILAQKESEVDSNEEVIRSVKARLDEIKKQYTDIEKDNKLLNEKRETASSENVKLQQKFDQLSKKREDIVAEIANNMSRIAYLDADIISINAEIERMGREVVEAKEQSQKCLDDVAEDKVVIQGFYKEIETLTLTSEETSGIKDLREKLNALETRKQKLSDSIAQDDLKRQFHNAEIAKLNEKRHEEELAITKVDSELEFMQQRVLEEYNETYETCVHQKDPSYDIVNSASEIKRLRTRISSLGNINANAIEECRELSERYDEFSTQMQDLEKAEADIKDAIKKLTDEMLVQFNEGFEEIRIHFKKIFKELFGGGSADLILDYSTSEDPLQAGVDIVAEPPGKKLQKISLLSGGEMALTAIAILFAILKRRPMPFCVLDEIEAPLDDANVERFARYLQNFSKETQFIVITHKKVTMEMSDALFGVTMQEKGVSKIVSVKLADIKDTFED